MIVKIDKSALRKKAKGIISSSKDIEKQSKKFLSIVDKINIAWEGADSLKYINVLKDKYVTALNELSDVINDYGEYLENVPEAYDLLDELFCSKNIDV